MRISDWSSDVCSSDLLTKVAATDLAQYGIRVNAICPGFINTNIFTSSLEVPDDSKDAAKAVIADMSAHAQPVARGGQPEDIANAVAYLASEESSFLTGTHLLVDGGLTIGQRHAWDPEVPGLRSEEHTSELQSLMRTSYAVFCLKT